MTQPSFAASHATPKGFVECDEIPFDFDRRRLSIVTEQKDQPEAGCLLITKGAPEGILERSEYLEIKGKVTAIDKSSRDRCLKVFQDLCGQGFRVLAVAYRQVGYNTRFTVADERALTLAGFLTFADPPSPDAAASIAALKRDGVTVKLLTGDNELVARHVCAQVGLENPAIVTGATLERTTDTALAHIAEETTIFARVSPMQKLRILHALKRRGHVIGYLGDGINDAPSLHAADVGISVSSAVDVAREAADIVLLRPGLQILHNGIIEGRRASANVFLPFLPMLPTQILLTNFVYDTAQITIPSDNVDPAYIGAPHRWDTGLIRNFMVFIGPISSIYDFLTFYVLLHFFHAGQAEFHTGWFVESLATQTLVLFVIRTMGNPLRSRPSRPLAATTIAVVILGVVLPFSPLAHILGFTTLPGSYVAFLAISTLTYLVLVEVAKRRLFAQAFC